MLDRLVAICPDWGDIVQPYWRPIEDGRSRRSGSRSLIGIDPACAPARQALRGQLLSLAMPRPGQPGEASRIGSVAVPSLGRDQIS